MKSVKEVLEFFIKCVEETETQFDMTRFVSRRNCMEQDLAEMTEKHPCGTSACIAGSVAVELALQNKETMENAVLHSEVVCYDWAREGFATVSSEERNDAEYCMYNIFYTPELYSQATLQNVTKERALEKLNEWKEFDSWSSLRKHISSIAGDE